MRKLSEHIMHLRTYRHSVPGMSSNTKLLDIIDFNYLEKSAMELEMRLLNKCQELEKEKARCVLLQQRLLISQKEIIRLEEIIEKQNNELSQQKLTSESEVSLPDTAVLKEEKPGPPPSSQEENPPEEEKHINANDQEEDADKEASPEQPPQKPQRKNHSRSKKEKRKK
jgi:hypothetical protein